MEVARSGLWAPDICQVKLSFFLFLAFFRLLKALTDSADLMDLCSLDQIKGPVPYSIVFFLVKKNRLRFEDYTYSCYNDKSLIYMMELSYS